MVEERVVRIGAQERHAPSARRLGQLHLSDDSTVRDIVKAEEALIKAANWGDLAAAYVLGCWHKSSDLAHSADWWLAYAHDGSELAAYLAGRVADESHFAGVDRSRAAHSSRIKREEAGLRPQRVNGPSNARSAPGTSVSASRSPLAGV